MLVQGRLRPDVLGGTGDEFCDADVLRTLRRRSLAALRAEVEPVDPQALGRLPARGGRGCSRSGRTGRSSATGTLRGVDGVARVVEQLAGAVMPASALETHVLPARVVDYSPAMLDELTAAGEVVWAGHGALAGHDGLVSVHPTAVADLTLRAADAVPGHTAARRGARRRSAVAARGSSARSPTASASCAPTTPPRARRTCPRRCGTWSGRGT